MERAALLKRDSLAADPAIGRTPQGHCCRAIDASSDRFSVAPPHMQNPEIACLVFAAMVRLLQSLSLGVIVVDAGSRLLFANGLAWQTLRRGDVITDSCGRLRPADPALGQRLVELIRRKATSDTDDAELIGLTRRNGHPLLVLVRSITESGTNPTGKVLLLTSDPDLRAGFAADDLGPLYDLTPAEMRLLGALLRGQSLKGYAGVVGITRNTAHSQLKAIFQKTGFGRQVELVSAMLGDPLLHLAASRGKLSLPQPDNGSRGGVAQRQR